MIQNIFQARTTNEIFLYVQFSIRNESLLDLEPLYLNLSRAEMPRIGEEEGGTLYIKDADHPKTKLARRDLFARR